MDAQIASAFGTSSVTIENGAFMWWYGDGPGDGTANGTVTYANNFTFIGPGLGGAAVGAPITPHSALMATAAAPVDRPLSFRAARLRLTAR